MLTDETEDRLGDLPDSLVSHILSFLNTKEAFQTRILSKRWNNLANNLPILTLDSHQFESLDSFQRALPRILSLRGDDSTSLHTLDFTIPPFDSGDDFPASTDVVFKSMVRYALSHDVRRLRYTITSHVNPFPPLFSSQTLTSLDISVPCRFRELGKFLLFPSHLNLPSLTNLTLSYFRFGAGDDGCADPFSAFNKLNTLILIDCLVTTYTGMYRDNYNQRLKLRLSLPNLCNAAFTYSNQKLCLSHPCSLKHLYIDVEQVGIDNSGKSVVEEDAAVLLASLQGLPNIKSLTVSSNTLQVLSLVPDLFNVKLTSFCNLESLEVQMKPILGQLYGILCYGICVISDFKKISQVTMIPDAVVDYLIQNSPSANVTFIPDKKPSRDKDLHWKIPMVEDTKAEGI